MVAMKIRPVGRWVLVEIRRDRLERGSIHQPEAYEWHTHEGTVLAVGKGTTGRVRKGDRVRFELVSGYDVRIGDRWCRFVQDGRGADQQDILAVIGDDVETDIPGRRVALGA